jgi:hypothetical protein
MKADQESRSPSDVPPASSDGRPDDAAHPTWRAPTVTRISLEQTLTGPGSQLDAFLSDTQGQA